ncbi:uncharacterized protein LOC102079008 [Oreochromis niloticus]|uniref:uncharacterized protein LOC102079008 n=1 Tax=Oreochromis niloticus TaxID=8128 RepID=UPI00090493C1|nr:uncharacterized protein LOC102079008 [Oreochromis niloticus]
MEKSKNPSPTSPSAAPTPQVQRLYALIEKLPDNYRKAATTLWEAYHRRHTNNRINEFFKCLEECVKHPHTDAVKVHIYCTAETFGADKDVLYQVNLSQQLLVESTDLQECNTVIVFCPINSRVRSDVEAAMAKAPGNKDIILVLMHHTRKTDYSTSGSEWSQIFPNVILHVDVLFHETERGLLSCQKNEQAICQIQQQLQDISKPTNTVGGLGLLASPQSESLLMAQTHEPNTADSGKCLIS